MKYPACFERSYVGSAATLVSLAALCVAIAGPGHTITITPVFDKTITSRSDASAVEASIDQAIGVYEADLESNVSIEIDFSWGTIDGYAVNSSDASESLSYVYTGFTYAQVVSALKQAAMTNPTDKALVSAVANLPATTPTGLADYAITEADAAALGLISPKASGFDGYVGFSSKLTYDLDPSNGTTSGAYDLVALTEHEISEVMGRISGVTSTKPSYATAFDLFRYSTPGKASFAYSSAAYFSIDGGQTDLANFNDVGGGDRCDWLTLATSTDAYDATASKGVDMGLSASDLTALDALGWDTANDPGGWVTTNVSSQHGLSLTGDVPEPASWCLMILGLAALGAQLRGRRVVRG